MPFFTGATDVIITGGTFNSIAGNSIYYTTGDANSQNFPGNTDDYNIDHQRPTVPDLEAGRDNEDPFKYPQRHRSTDKPDIIQERIEESVPVEKESSDPQESPRYPAVVSTRGDILTPSTGLEQPGSMPKQQEGDDVEEWSRHIHPEGWYYFFRQRHNESHPGNIYFHEICGARENTEAIDTWTNEPRTLDYGGLHVQTYVDHTRMFASEDEDVLLKKSYTDKEG